MILDSIQRGDVHIDYPYEDVMFRYDHASRRFFRKFYGQPNEKEVPFDSTLLNEAMRFGAECDAATYLCCKTVSVKT